MSMKKVITLKKSTSEKTIHSIKVMLYTLFVSTLLFFSYSNDMLFLKELGVALFVVSLVFFVHLQNSGKKNSKVVQLYKQELESLERKIN
jgi:hypothetical protein